MDEIVVMDENDTMDEIILGRAVFWAKQLGAKMDEIDAMDEMI